MSPIVPNSRTHARGRVQVQAVVYISPPWNHRRIIEFVIWQTTVNDPKNSVLISHLEQTDSPDPYQPHVISSTSESYLSSPWTVSDWLTIRYATSISSIGDQLQVPRLKWGFKAGCHHDDLVHHTRPACTYTPSRTLILSIYQLSVINLEYAAR